LSRAKILNLIPVIVQHSHYCLTDVNVKHYMVVQKSGHPRNSMDVRFFGPPCIWHIVKQQYQLTVSKNCR